MCISIYLCSIEERWKLVTREEYEVLFFFYLYKFSKISVIFYKYEEKHKAPEKYVPALNSVIGVPAQ